jgi:hypothetical protein
MSSTSSPARILVVDHVMDGVLVTFGDDTSTLYTTEFLFAHRNDEGTQTMSDQPEGGSESDGTARDGSAPEPE